MKPPVLRIDVVSAVGVTVLLLSGELGADSAGSLAVETERLIVHGRRHFILDCDAVTSCDSVGMRALLRLWGRVQPDGSVIVARPSTTVGHLIRINGFAGMFGDLEDAVEPSGQGRPGGTRRLGDWSAVEKQFVAERLSVVLEGLAMIEQAKGVVAERTGFDMEQALTLLRDHAAHHQVRLADVARRVVDGTLGPATLDPLY